MLEKGRRAEISRIFDDRKLAPNVKFRTFDDYALLSMVEVGIAVGVLPKLILGRHGYLVAVRSIAGRPMRRILLALNDLESLSPAAKRFLECFEETLGSALSLRPGIADFLRGEKCGVNDAARCR